MDQKNVAEEQAKRNIMITVKVTHVKATFQKSAENSNFKRNYTFFVLNPHFALFILLQALKNSHSKKNLPYKKTIILVLLLGNAC